jgi:hypothetical protein
MKLASHGPRGAHVRWDRQAGNLPLRSGFPEEMVPPEGFEPSTSRFRSGFRTCRLLSADIGCLLGKRRSAVGPHRVLSARFGVLGSSGEDEWRTTAAGSARRRGGSGQPLTASYRWS